MTVQCPWCEYEGLKPSVEAHISGKADADHQGKVGHDLREHLPQVSDEQVVDLSAGDYADVPVEAVEQVEEDAGVPVVAVGGIVALAVLFYLYKRRQARRREEQQHGGI